MGKMFASFYSCLVFAGFWKVKFWRSLIKCQYFNDGWADFHKKIYIFISLSWFFWKPKKLGSYTASNWGPGDPDVKDDPNDPLTRWPNDPVPCLVGTDQFSITHSLFHSGLKTFLFCKSFPYRSLSFFQDWLRGFPRLLLLLLSYHFLLFSFFVLHFLVVVYVR